MQYAVCFFAVLLLAPAAYAAEQSTFADWWAWFAIGVVVIVLAVGFRFVRIQTKNNVRVMAFMFGTILRGRLQVLAVRFEQSANLWHDRAVVADTTPFPVAMFLETEYDIKNDELLTLALNAELSILGVRKLRHALNTWHEMIQIVHTLPVDEQGNILMHQVDKQAAQALANALSSTSEYLMQASFDVVCY